MIIKGNEKELYDKCRVCVVPLWCRVRSYIGHEIYTRSIAIVKVISSDSNSGTNIEAADEISKFEITVTTQDATNIKGMEKYGTSTVHCLKEKGNYSDYIFPFKYVCR